MTAVSDLGLFLALIPAAGHLWLSRRLGPEVSRPERWALTLGVGFWSVALCAACTWFVPLHRLGLWDPVWVVRATALVVVAAAWWTWRQAPEAPPPRTDRADLVTLAAGVLVFAVFFLGVEDEHFSRGCLYASLDALADPDPGAPLPIDRLAGDERFGNVVAAWVLAGFCPTLIERVGQGFFAALLFLSSAALGRRLTGRTWPGLVAGMALILTDDVFGYEIFNQNMIAGSTATLFILVLLQNDRVSRAVLAPFLAAMLVGSRYVALVGMGALACGVRPGEARGGFPREVMRTGLRFLAFLAPTLAAVALGSVSISNILAQRLYNLPVHSDLVRTPLLPFPMWLGWPLDLLVQWDLAGIGLLVLGLAFLARAPHPRRVLMVLSAFGAPLVLALSVQENWLEPEKMSLKLVWTPVLVGPIAIALGRVGSGGRRVLAVFAAVCVGLGAALAAVRPLLASLRFPEDARVRGSYPGLPGEEPDLLEFERQRWLDWGLVPFPRSPGVLRVLDRKLEQVARSLVHGEDPHATPSISELAVLLLEETVENQDRVFKALAPPGETTRETRAVFLDLRRRPILASSPVGTGPVPRTPVLDLGDGRECAMTPVRGMRVAYADRPMRVLACARHDEVFVSLAPPVIPTLERDEPAPPGTPADWVLVEPPDLRGLPITPAVELRLPLRTRRLTILDHLYLEPTRIYARDVWLGPDGPEAAGVPFVWQAN